MSNPPTLSNALRRCGMALALSLSLCGLPDQAQAKGFDAPSSVMLSPQGGRLTVEAAVAVTTEDGKSTLTLLLPQEAGDFTLTVPGHSIARWTTTLVRLEDAPGATAQRRAALLEEQTAIQGEIQAAKARLNLWATPPSAALSIEDMARRENMMQKAIPLAAASLAQWERAAQALEQELASLPETARQAQSITVTLAKPVAEDAPPTLPVRYSYTLSRCGWQPMYSFDAQPDQEQVRVRLTADVWQFSGMDWSDADITLTAQGGQREPAPVRPWLILAGDDALPRPMPMNLMARSAAPMMAAEAKTMDTLPMQESTAFTSWHLGKRGMTEGKVCLPMAEDTWKAPLQWLARPSVNDSRVWLMVRHTLASTQAWPTGQASFTIEDNAVGTGVFAPQGNNVTLFFGVDPRITVQTEPDARLSGKTGIIDKRKTWTWAWKYTVTNGRGKAVNVRLEEPAPQSGDEAIIITYDDKPTAHKGQDHTLYWDVTVPGRGKATVQHNVTISAPQDLKVYPGM